MEHFFNSRAGGCDCNGEMCDRVLERDGMCMEQDGTIVVAAWGTVFEVTLDGTADVGQLASYLVVTAGVEIDVKEVISTVRDGNLSVFEAR